MYVMQIDRREWGVSRHLFDMSKAELAKAQVSATEGREYRKASADEAHRHVKRGEIHSTRLWVDDLGRVRNAK